MKYLYLLHTWGGFYNKEHQDKHGETEGYYYFNTKQDREDYLFKLDRIQTDLNAGILAAFKGEGYHVKDITTLHRVIRWEGKEYYSKYELGPCYPFDAAKYHLEWKWCPGFNDYPLGKDFDYEANEVEIVQEWITGAFDIKDK